MNKTNHTFLQMDHVRYTGNSPSLNEIRGGIGEVVGRIQNTNGIVVDFKGTAYVIDPQHLEHQAYNDAEDKHIRALDRKWKTTEDKRRTKSKNADKA